MKIYVFSETTPGTVRRRLGRPEYSYLFVREKFLPVLCRLGRVEEIAADACDLPSILGSAPADDSVPALLFFFGPPQRLPEGLPITTVCVFAWEYASIPTETWDDNPFNDWRVPLAHYGHAITLSSYAAEAVRRALPQGLHLAVIPAPISQRLGWREWRDRLLGRAALKRAAKVEAAGRIYDSRDYRISHDVVEPLRSERTARRANWSGEPLDWRFGSDERVATLALVGFYNADEWGSWSRTGSPWITLPWRVQNPCRVQLHLVGIGPNIGREIEIEMGGDEQRITLGSTLEWFELQFAPQTPADAIHFRGIVPAPGGVSAADPRTLGLGIAGLRVELPQGEARADYGGVAPRRAEAKAKTERRRFDGVVYTAVFNPEDGRKNWEDMVTAFCWTFRDREDATLVLKMSHHNPATFYGRLMALWSTLHPFRCRIVALHGFLDERQYRMLIAATSYVVNTSRCEGQCLPLMEFMRCGVPAVAPRHTAMLDYVDDSNTFVVDASPAPDCWPQDPRRAYRTFSYRIDWESLCRAFASAHAVASDDPTRYRAMADAAAETIAGRFSVDSVRAGLARFMDEALSNG